jgi:hypothetical protein
LSARTSSFVHGVRPGVFFLAINSDPFAESFHGDPLRYADTSLPGGPHRLLFSARHCVRCDVTRVGSTFLDAPNRLTYSNGRGTGSQDPSHRHGRFLCVRRAARQPGSQEPTGRGRLPGEARHGCCRELRGTTLWGSLRDAFDRRDAEVPRARVRRAEVRRLPRRLATDPCDLQGLYALGRAALS